jgi:7,8-dihydropterin-6-yl-methyl-4-(beta-D-ribofuranosyl)aminobenzene 5'-phosphate synthase
MVERATKIMQKEVLLVLGGFHLLRDSAHGVQKVVRRLQEMNVRHVAPTHCSGGDARQRFAESYAENYLDCGVGRIITAKDLAGLRA